MDSKGVVDFANFEAFESTPALAQTSLQVQLDDSLKSFEKQGEELEEIQTETTQSYSPNPPSSTTSNNINSSIMGIFGKKRNELLAFPSRQKIKTFVLKSSSQVSNFIRSSVPAKLSTFSEFKRPFGAEKESNYALISASDDYPPIYEDGDEEGTGKKSGNQFIQHLERIPTAEELINRSK